MQKLSKYLSVILLFLGYQLQAQQKVVFALVDNTSGKLEPLELFPTIVNPMVERVTANVFVNRTGSNQIQFSEIIDDGDTVALLNSKRPVFLGTPDKLFGIAGTALEYMMGVQYVPNNSQYYFLRFNAKSSTFADRFLVSNVKSMHPSNGVYNKAGWRYYFTTTDSSNNQHLHIYEYDNNVLRNKIPLVSNAANFNLRGLIYSAKQDKIFAIEKDLNSNNNFLVSIDTGTGALNRINQLVGIDSFMHSNLINDLEGQFIFVGKDITGQTKLYTVDVTDGTILHEPDFPDSDINATSGNYVTSVFYGAGRRLYAVSRQELNGWVKPLNYVTFIPNAITPNFYGPIRNNKFYVDCHRCIYYKIQIFDRKGVAIFNGTENQPWNGTYDGDPVSNGVFGYKVTTLDERGNEHTYLGNLTVIVE